MHSSKNDNTRRDRRRFLTAAVLGAGAVAATPWLQPYVIAGQRSKERIKIGQIGTLHEHASGKMDTFRKLADDYEVVGIVEPDPERRKKCEKSPTYRGLKWMTEEELFNTKGLKAVAVETFVSELVPTAARCIAAGMHIHLDKPGARRSSRSNRCSMRPAAAAWRLGYVPQQSGDPFCFRRCAGWLGRVSGPRRDEPADPPSYRKWLGQFRAAHVQLRLP